MKDRETICMEEWSKHPCCKPGRELQEETSGFCTTCVVLLYQILLSHYNYLKIIHWDFLDFYLRHRLSRLRYTVPMAKITDLFCKRKNLISGISNTYFLHCMRGRYRFRTLLFIYVSDFSSKEHIFMFLWSLQMATKIFNFFPSSCLCSHIHSGTVNT